MSTEQAETAMVKVEIVDGVEGPCVVVNDRRVAGPKPWGGGTTMRSWLVPEETITNALFGLRQPDDPQGGMSEDE